MAEALAVVAAHSNGRLWLTARDAAIATIKPPFVSCRQLLLIIQPLLWLKLLLKSWGRACSRHFRTPLFSDTRLARFDIPRQKNRPHPPSDIIHALVSGQTHDT